MTSPVRLCLVLHNHQPVGNFDHVFEQALADAYLPFLDVLEEYDFLRVALHTSGPLLEWLDERRGDYLDRLRGLVAAGRMEIVGGAYYEPILTMIPPRDRIGQIVRFAKRLRERLGAEVRGMWMPERVWEQSLVADLAAAGVEYTILDDFHFKNAGLPEDDLDGYYVTEDDGRTVCVFPGNERLRYLIPFAQPHETIDFLRQFAERRPGAVLLFGDDGEKFGSWPETHKHVYEDGWLRRFFDLLGENRDWIEILTPAEVIDKTPPMGRVYLPEASYREMTEWALPALRQGEYESVVREMRDDPRWPRVKQFVRGGFWRNFKMKYPETNEMYARMMHVSRRLADMEQNGAERRLLEQARDELHRGQCNCSYWHGAFGGIYLPHLRNAVYQHLIAADTLLDRAEGRRGGWVEATAADYNFDARQEVRLACDRLMALLAPAEGGMLYELDVKSIEHNLLATLARRPESYHKKVLAGAGQAVDGGGLHEQVKFKHEGLDRALQYDRHLKKGLIDHFFAGEVSLEAVARGEARDVGDFAQGVYEARLRRSADRVGVLLSRTGRAGDGGPIKLSKLVTLEAGRSSLKIAYRLEDVPHDGPLHFAVELNFAGLPAGADDRYFYCGDGERLGQLGQRLELQDATDLHLVDEWLGIDVGVLLGRPSGVWAFPVETVSQSEGGYELVHQSVTVMPHWRVQPDAEGRWEVSFEIAADTALAESRRRPDAALEGTAAAVYVGEEVAT